MSFDTESYMQLCRLCASYQAIKMEIYGKEGTGRNLVEKIEICLPFKWYTTLSKAPTTVSRFRRVHGGPKENDSTLTECSVYSPHLQVLGPYRSLEVGSTLTY
uniref:Uncharacterized protein n=1 Tax=Timema poppense TaxID=170557 RepID=A0A7R9H818_TIMPO|nr:unnamed protein product [Timema poppensis]